MFIDKKYFITSVAIFLFTFLLIYQPLSAQQYQKEKIGINVGIVIAFGTHFNRFGVVLNSYYQNNHFQINPEIRLHFNLKNLGPKSNYIEAVTSLGIVYGYGKRQLTDTNNFFNTISNQTQYKNSIGYVYNFYINNIETSQKTGIISIQVDHFNLILENDLFAQPKLDRFRTGAFLLRFQKDNYQVGLNTTLFTGLMGAKVIDENYPYSHLYKNTVNGKYTKFSHGLLSAQLKYVGDYYQTYQANMGIDSERVRHVVQNKLIHDVFNSKKHKHAHIPMLDKNREQYLFKEGQKVKPLQFYMNGFMNPLLFY